MMNIRWFSLVSATLFALTAAAYEGPTFKVSAWRGETCHANIPDRLTGEMARMNAAEMAVVPGIEIALFEVRDVPYPAKPHGSRFDRRLDLVTPFVPGGRQNAAPTICQVRVATDVKPGKYAIGPLQVQVIDRVLPPAAEWKYFLDLWQHPWAVARYFGVRPFSAEHYERMKPVLRTLAECGQKALTTTLLDLPWNHQCYDAYHSMIGRVRKADGTWTFDYRVFDEYVEFGRQCGIGPDIACYTMCPWGYVVRWQDEKGETHRVTAKPGTPEFEDYWGDFLVDFAAHLKAKGWFDDTYIAMDERSPKDVKIIAEYIQQKAPGLKISMAGNRKPSEFAGITIDNYCQAIFHMSDEFLSELSERRAKGYRTTCYVCCSPAHPNTFMMSEDDEAFWLTAYAGLAGFDGFLRWAANSWPVDPYANAGFGGWKAGDTFLVYPQGEYSMRLLSLRAGVVAAEKLRILESMGHSSKSIPAARQKYGYREALDPNYDCGGFRREIEKIANWPK